MWIQESIKRGNKMRDHFSLSGVDVFIKDVNTIKIVIANIIK